MDISHHDRRSQYAANKRWRERNPLKYKKIQSVATKKWIENNPEKYNEGYIKSRKKYLQSPKGIARRREYYRKNIEKMKELDRLRRIRDKEKIKARKKRYYSQNREKLIQLSIEYRKKRLQKKCS